MKKEAQVVQQTGKLPVQEVVLAQEDEVTVRAEDELEAGLLLL